MKGPTDDSYGIEVARLAGVPSEITRRAKEILRDLEADAPKRSAKAEPKAEAEVIPMNDTISLFTGVENDIAEQIKATDINTLTPIEAMNLIFKWKNELM